MRRSQDGLDTVPTNNSLQTDGEFIGPSVRPINCLRLIIFPHHPTLGRAVVVLSPILLLLLLPGGEVRVGTYTVTIITPRENNKKSFSPENS